MFLFYAVIAKNCSDMEHRSGRNVEIRRSNRNLGVYRSTSRREK